MADELPKRKVEHTTKQKQLKQPGQKSTRILLQICGNYNNVLIILRYLFFPEVSTSQKKLSGRGKEKDDEQER